MIVLLMQTMIAVGLCVTWAALVVIERRLLAAGEATERRVRIVTTLAVFGIVSQIGFVVLAWSLR